MTDETPEQINQRRARIRRLKKFLRPLPRRANLHRYPVLKWFASAARKRDYLWSLHYGDMVRAFYIGWIIALIPMYGLQMAAAFVASFFLRANCIIAMALQWITNPLTIPPIIVGQYFLGDWVMRRFFGAAGIDNSFVDKIRNTEFWTAVSEMASGHNVAHIVEGTLLGGFIIAIVGAVITHAVYHLCAKRRKIV